MFRATLSHAAQASSSAVRTAVNNPYKAQKQWPPDFTKLSTKHQFRFERRYRRRAKLKWARPRWMKITKIAQWGLPSFVLAYAVLVMDWGDLDTPFPQFRQWLKRQAGSIWTTSATQLPRPPLKSSIDEASENPSSS